MTGRFRAFADGKTRDAIAAALPPYVTAVEHPLPDMIAIGDDWTRQAFDGPFYLSPLPDGVPACSLVFVQSADGNTGTRNPQSLGGGETDKHLIYEGLSRVAADAVLAGGATIRGGRIAFSVWRPELVRLREALGKPRHPVQIVATLAGVELEREMLYNVPELQVILLTTAGWHDRTREAIAGRPWITPIVMDSPESLASAFQQLRSMGIERVSAVGGRKLATQLIDFGLVQDVYLTTSPHAGGEPGTPMYPTPLDARLVVRKQGTDGEAGVIFEHLRLREPDDRPIALEP